MVKLKYITSCLLKMTYGSSLLNAGRHMSISINGIITHIVTYYSYLLKICKYITIAVDGIITPLILLMTRLMFIDTSLRQCGGLEDLYYFLL